MKRFIHVLLIPTVVVSILLGCESTEPSVKPLIEPKFSVTVSGEAWEPHRGGALVLSNDQFGAISIRMAGPNDGRRRLFRLSIDNTGFEWLPVSEYDISSLSNGFVESAKYEQEDSQGETEQWRSERLNVAVINITSIIEIDGLEYLSGTFRASPCNGDLFPACIAIEGSFEDLRLFYDPVVMNLTIGVF